MISRISNLQHKYHLPIWLLPTLMVIGVLAYGIIAAILIADEHERSTRLLLGLPLLGIIGLFIIEERYFRLGVLLLPITALAVPISFATGTQSRVPISLILSLLLMTVWGISQLLRGWKLTPSPLNRPMLVFGMICVVSLFWGIVWRDPILIEHATFFVTQVASLATFLASIGVALLIGNFVQTHRQLRYLLGVFLLCLSLMALLRSLDLPLTFLNDGGLWGLWLVAIIYGLLLTRPGIRWYWQLLLLLILVGTLRLLLMRGSYWLSGWAPAIVAIYAITFFHSRRALLILLLASALLYQTPVAQTFLQRVTSENIAEGSDSRLEIWQRNFDLIGEHWLLGMGPAGYALYNDTYYPGEVRSSHNNYIDIMAQFGLPGTLAWLWLMLASVREGWMLARSAAPGFLRSLAIIAAGGWVGALSAMMLGDWVLPFAYNITITGFSHSVYHWIFLGTLISIRHILHTQATLP